MLFWNSNQGENKGTSKIKHMRGAVKKGGIKTKHKVQEIANAPLV